jgi:CP family cyanate transporter-like MFS transporter
MLLLVLPLVGNSWQWGLFFWSVPVALIAAAVMAFAPRAAVATNPDLVRRKWWPDWRNMLIWRLGIMLGAINAVYFTGNAFLPDYLRGNGQGEWISVVLTAWNLGQLPASFVLLAVAGRLERKAWPYMLFGSLSVLATGGMVFGTGLWIVVAAAVQGFAAAGILILVLALPPLLSKPDDVHRVTAAMFTISYSCAVIVPIISGMVWDLTGIASMAFVPLALCGILVVILAPAINHVPRIGGVK